MYDKATTVVWHHAGQCPAQPWGHQQQQPCIIRQQRVDQAAGQLSFHGKV